LRLSDRPASETKDVHGFITLCDHANDQIVASAALSPATNDKAIASEAKLATFHFTILDFIKGNEPSPIANVVPGTL
jgi:hypothetical protein